MGTSHRSFDHDSGPANLSTVLATTASPPHTKAPNIQAAGTHSVSSKEASNATQSHNDYTTTPRKQSLALHLTTVLRTVKNAYRKRLFAADDDDLGSAGKDVGILESICLDISTDMALLLIKESKRPSLLAESASIHSTADTGLPSPQLSDRDRAVLASIGSQFAHVKTEKHGKQILPHTKARPSKRLLPVGVTSRSRSVTLRLYLLDDTDERKYKLSRI